MEDVRISAYFADRYNLGNGTNSLLEEIKLKDSHIDFIAGTFSEDKQIQDSCDLIAFDEDIFSN